MLGNRLATLFPLVARLHDGIASIAMRTGQSKTLLFPSFLHGDFDTIRRHARREGRRCAEACRENAPFPIPRDLRELQPGEVVMTLEAGDLIHETPAWRLYLFFDVASGFWEGMNWQDTPQEWAAFESFHRGTPWGALYFATSRPAPTSAERTALRLGAVLHFWEHLQDPRYRHLDLNQLLTLEELMMFVHDETLGAWCPEGASSARELLEEVARRMTRATKEDCIEAVLRRVALILADSHEFKHPEVLGDPSLLRERLSALSAEDFQRISGADRTEVYPRLLSWDSELELQ